MVCPKCKNEDISDIPVPDLYNADWYRCGECYHQWSVPRKEIVEENISRGFSKFKSVKELIKNHQGAELKKVGEDELVEKGYVNTLVFGWITKKEIDWLNAQLRLCGWNKTAETLTGIPVHEVENKKGEIVEAPEEFILKFYSKGQRDIINNDGFITA